MSTLQVPRSAPPSRSRTGLVVAGVVALLAGVAGALGLWLAAEQRYDDGVDALARAPVGCETAVTIESTGELLVYAEVAGVFDETTGNCAASGVFRADSPAPTVNVDVTAPDASSVAVEAVSGSEYDRGGFRGTQVGRIDVTQTGDHVVRVASSDGTFAVAIGNDPQDGVFALRAAALVALAVGAVVALILITIGRRTAAAPTEPGAPSGPPPSWWEADRPVSAPPQRPAPPPRIPGQPAGPGWGEPDEWGEPTRIPGQPGGPGWGEPDEWGEPTRIPGQPGGPGWGEPDEQDELPRSPWAPPSV